MRIGIVCYPTHGGSGVAATELGLQLAHRDHSVHFIAYDRPFRLERLAVHRELDVHFHRVEVPTYPVLRSDPYALALANRVAELIQTQGLQVIHAHYAVPHATGLYLARELAGAAEVGLAVTLHGTDVTVVGSDPALARITAHSLNQVDAVVAVSDYLRRAAWRLPGLRQGVQVIPNFVDPAVFHPGGDPRVRSQLAAPEEKLLCHVSNFRPVKQVAQVIEAFAQVARETPARLALVGDGPERPAAEAQAEALGVGDRVSFLGFQRRVAPFLAVADLFVLSSSEESFGLAAAEAMACRVPVVAYRTGGVAELVEDRVSGFLVHPGDTQALAESALRILLDEDLRYSMALAGEKRVRTQFTPDRVIGRYEDLYGRITGLDPLDGRSGVPGQEIEPLSVPGSA